jgi:predicted trehalose synthase
MGVSMTERELLQVVYERQFQLARAEYQRAYELALRPSWRFIFRRGGCE